jgi:hypothetical protein
LDPFVYKSLPLRVVFGEGTSARLAEEAELLAIRRALVVTTPGRERLGREMAEQLGDRFAALFAGAVAVVAVDRLFQFRRLAAMRRLHPVEIQGRITEISGRQVALLEILSRADGLEKPTADLRVTRRSSGR